MRIFPVVLTALLGLAEPLLAQTVTMPLWPRGVPEVIKMDGPEQDTTKPTDKLIAGRRIIKLANVSQPTLAVYKPVSKNTGAAVLVFPGGGYRILAYDLEGTEVCTWLNSIGVTCVLVKYRVPILSADGKDEHYPKRLEDLEDAQRAMRLTRQHAAEWGIDPKKIGVLGFSAGAHLAAVLSIHSAQSTYKAVDAADSLNARPDFALILYPGYLSDAPALDKVAEGVVPDAQTPPTFLLQAEDDPVHEENALLYFQALKTAKVPAELHLFAEGGHGYGLRPTELPVTHWPVLAETWFRSIHMIPQTK